MTQVYLVRHGQTAWNAELIFRGRRDIELNERGHREASAIAGALRDKNLDAIYASPLTRALETARPLAALLHREITPVQGLTDISYGDWEGVAYQEIKTRYPDILATWEQEPELVRFPHGETLDEVRERSYGVLRELAEKHANESILIVSHRVVNKVLLCAALGLSTAHFWNIKQDTGCINVLEYSSQRFVLCLLNDTSHLGGIADGADQLDF
jgi:broad specificity phosphatase PhoE